MTIFLFFFKGEYDAMAVAQGLTCTTESDTTLNTTSKSNLKKKIKKVKKLIQHGVHNAQNNQNENNLQNDKNDQNGQKNENNEGNEVEGSDINWDIPAISLPNGCNSLPLELIPLLERFDKIYLWLDNDKSGWWSVFLLFLCFPSETVLFLSLSI